MLYRGTACTQEMLGSELSTGFVLFSLFVSPHHSLYFLSLNDSIDSQDEMAMDTVDSPVRGQASSLTTAPGGHIHSLDAFHELCLREQATLYLTLAGSARLQVIPIYQYTNIPIYQYWV